MVKKRILFAGLVFVFASIMFVQSTKNRQALAKEKAVPAPSFKAESIRGRQCSIPNSDNKYTVLLFWTTWCPHCSDAIRELTAYSHKYYKNIDFYAIGVGETEYKIKDFVRGRGIDIPVIADPRGYIASQYYVRGVPTIAIVDKDGYVLDYGYMLSPMMRRLIKKIKEDGDDQG